jgi:hypothetical protein
MDTFGGGTASSLTIHGHWLESAGFKIGVSVGARRLSASWSSRGWSFPKERGCATPLPECFLACDHDVDLDLAQRPGPFCGISRKM